jgi:hypothetical protein
VAAAEAAGDRAAGGGVHRKAATLVLLFALPVLTLGATGLAVAGVAHLLGLALLWVGVAMYYLAGAVYVRMVLERLGHRAGAGS